MKLILTGGGTLGSVAPLIAVWQTLKERVGEIETVFIGTQSGPEKDFLKQYPAIKFLTVPAGKFRRYFSFKNFFDPFLILAGFFKSLLIILKCHSQVVISAGGFVSVPVIYAAKILGLKVIIHQLDLKPTLSNKLTQDLADKITVTFEKSLSDFPKKKSVLVGSVLRKEIKITNNPNQRLVGLWPKILILGGGTGAFAINQIIAKAALLIPDDIFINHVTGKDKGVETGRKNYRQFELLTTDYYQKIAEADLVISRAGLSTLMELSYLKKPTMVIPLPNSHQEANAAYFAEKNAATYLKQNELTPEILAAKIKALLNDPKKLEKLSENIDKIMKHGGEEKVAEEILDLIKS